MYDVKKYFNLQDPQNKDFFKNLFEIILIILWALWVGKEFLSLDPDQIPLGREYGMAVSTHNFWNDLSENQAFRQNRLIMLRLYWGFSEGFSES